MTRPDLSPGHAPVTRDHRLLALMVVCDFDDRDKALRWNAPFVERGEAHDEMSNTVRVAQAIADAEQRGARAEQERLLQKTAEFLRTTSLDWGGATDAIERGDHLREGT